MLACTMVADRPSNVVMQIVNTNDEEVRLQKGTCLGNLEEVVPVVGEPSDEDNADSFSHIESVIGVWMNPCLVNTEQTSGS